MFKIITFEGSGPLVKGGCHRSRNVLAPLMVQRSERATRSAQPSVSHAGSIDFSRDVLAHNPHRRIAVSLDNGRNVPQDSYASARRTSL
jgi:hypothetical protein